MKVKTKSNYLDILQILRGLAALMVVCHHTITSIEFYHQIENPFFNFIRSVGKYGVDFFFVLSGFIISYTAYNKYSLPNAFSDYIKNRLIRIYVPYLPIGIAMLLVYSFLPNLSNSARDISVLTTLTLLPHGHPALSVAWTLTFELCFYLLFSISFFSRRSWNYFVILWICLIIVANYAPIEWFKETSNPFLILFFSPYNIEFILGYFLSLLILKNKKYNLNNVAIILVLASVGLVYCIWKKFTLFYFSTHFLFSITVFLILYLFIVYYTKKINKRNFMMLIGNATYSIYLLHNPLQAILIRIYPKINSSINMLIALLIVLIISSLIGYLYYLVFEKRAIQKVKAVV